MSKIYGVLSYVCGSLVLALVAVLLMAGTPVQADPGMGGDGEEQCPGAIPPTPCSEFDSNPMFCRASLCSGPTNICFCIYNPFNIRCKCPGN